MPMKDLFILNPKIYVVLCGIAFPLIVMGEIVNLDFWIIDDHNIFGMMGSDGVFTLNEFLKYLYFQGKIVLWKHLLAP